MGGLEGTKGRSTLKARQWWKIVFVHHQGKSSILTAFRWWTSRSYLLIKITRGELPTLIRKDRSPSYREFGFRMCGLTVTWNQFRPKTGKPQTAS